MGIAGDRFHRVMVGVSWLSIAAGIGVFVVILIYGRHPG